MLDTEKESLETVRDYHFPQWLKRRAQAYIREHGSESGLPKAAYLPDIQILKQVIKINYALAGKSVNLLPLDSMFDHWGSIQRGKVWVTEPYMYTTMWPLFEILADSLNLKLNFTGTSTHNPKPEGADVLTHSYCSRVAFQLKEDNDAT